MKPRNILLLAALLSFILAAPGATRAASKAVMVYYMPWFTAKPYSDSWGWHWTMDHFNPDTGECIGGATDCLMVLSVDRPV